MVFLSCLLVTIILYYLQIDGLIYVTIIAVVAELINLFMTQTMTTTAKNKTTQKYGKIIIEYKSKITSQIKTINQLKKIRDESVRKLYKANQTIKKYEEELGIEDSEAIDIPDKLTPEPEKKVPADDPPLEKEEKPEEFTDLPAGSNRKELPI